MHRRFAGRHAAGGWRGPGDAFGAGAAILVGDLLLAWTGQMFHGSGLPPEALRRGQPVLDAMGTEVICGQYLDLLAGLAVAVAMGVIMVNAMRVGLITRWMGVVGILSGILIFLPIGGATLEVVPSFWLVAMGILYAGKWPNGQPPA